MFKFLFFALLGSGWLLAASAVHVVRTPASLTTVSIVTKNALAFDDTYVDARAWTGKDVPEHRDTVRRLVQAGRSDLLAHVVDAKGHDLGALLVELAGSPKPDDGKAAADPSLVKSALAQFQSAKKNAADVSRVLAGAR